MFQAADLQRFIWLRLFENRAKIYFTLLGIGQASADELSKQTKLTPRDVHIALRELMEMGLVQEMATNKSSFFIVQQTCRKEKNGLE